MEVKTDREFIAWCRENWPLRLGMDARRLHALSASSVQAHSIGSPEHNLRCDLAELRLDLAEAKAELKVVSESLEKELKEARLRIEQSRCYVCLNMAGWDKEDRIHCPACNSLRIALNRIDAAIDAVRGKE